MKKQITFLIMLAVIATPLTALADFPDYSACYTEMAYQGSETVSILSTPDGMGKPFTEAYLPDGTIVDATVTLYFIDISGTPIAGFPFEDIWMGTPDDNFVPCIGGSNPDSNTDANGVTTWVNPMRAGGYNMESITIYINGDALYSQPLNMHINSPDINGDLIVDLLDVTIFSTDFFGTYHYRSDFHCDGTLNLADLGKFAESLHATCP